MLLDEVLASDPSSLHGGGSGTSGPTNTNTGSGGPGNTQSAYRETSHYHGISGHTHSVNSHTHSVSAHRHSFSSHSHQIRGHFHLPRCSSDYWQCQECIVQFKYDWVLVKMIACLVSTSKHRLLIIYRFLHVGPGDECRALVAWARFLPKHAVIDRWHINTHSMRAGFLTCLIRGGAAKSIAKLIMAN